jgi:hypothetical protein
MGEGGRPKSPTGTAGIGFLGGNMKNFDGPGNRARGATVARLRSTLALIGALALGMAQASEAHAKCIRQSLLNHDYCGAEAGKLKNLIPERPIGDFKGACAAHDVCYQFGGEEIVGLMEQRYKQSMLSATSKQKREFRSDIERIKVRCDKAFLSDMNRSCNRVISSLQLKCRDASALYFAAVRTRLGSNAFDQAIDQAFTCRTR